MSGASPVSVPAARCVLWHPCGSPPPNALLDALQRRGLAWTATDRTLTAVVQALTPPPIEGAPAHPIPTVLVLVDPPHLRALDEVLDVIARYRPRTALWVFDLGDPTRLKSMQALEVIAKYVPHKSESTGVTVRATAAPAIEPKAGATGWRLQLTEPRAESDTPSRATPTAGPTPLAGQSSVEIAAPTSPEDASGIGLRSVIM